jgi:hypothetical protein
MRLLELDHFRGCQYRYFPANGVKSGHFVAEPTIELKPSQYGLRIGLGETARDLRVDACRGIALWFIFLDHVPNNVGSWLTLSHYGFSDTTELFMFVSGITCALAYGQVQRQDGWSAVFGHTVRRSWEIYSAFLILTIACVVVAYLLGGDRFADETNTRILLEHPGPALWRAAILQYRAVNTDVLPSFVLFHLFFPLVLWLLMMKPNVTLGASFVLYVLVQIFGWNLPQWPSNRWFFNPFAWQFLIVLGAWWIMCGREVWRSWLTSGPVIVAAAVYLVLAFVVALSWSIKSLEAVVPPVLAKLIYPIDKSDLDPLRLLHFLAIAVLVAKFVPRDWTGLKTPILNGAVRCGENSLEIYCAGVLLSLAGDALLKVSPGVPTQVAVSAVGVAILIAAGAGLTWLKIQSRSQAKLF